MTFLLKGPERRRLREIFNETFDRNGLAQALEEAEPSRRLEDVVADRAFQKQLGELVAVAEEEGWLDDLGRLLASERAEQSDLVEAAGEIIERAGQRAETTMPRGRRVGLNLGLAALLVALAVTYYYLHLEPLWTRLGLFGGVALAVVSIVSGILAKVQKDAGRWLRQLLERRGATRWLAIACGALLLLGISTSSIYLAPDAVGAEVNQVIVDLGRSETAAEFSITGEQVAGRLYFGRLRPTDVRLEVQGIDCTYRLAGRLRPGLSLRPRLEPALTLRVLPAPSLIRTLPRPAVERPRNPSSAKLSIGERTLAVADFRTHGVHVGASEEDVRNAVCQGREALSQLLEGRLRQVSEDRHAEILRDWQGDSDHPPPVLVVPELAPGVSIEVCVEDEDENSLGCASGERLDELEGGQIKGLFVEKSDVS